MLINCNTYVAKSDIQGKGLFTYYPIEKGTPVWIKSQTDISILSSSIPEEYRSYLDRYSTVTGVGKFHVYHLDGDDTKYMNHSENPNIGFFGEADVVGLALRDIEENEELTCNYKEITTESHFQYLMSLS